VVCSGEKILRSNSLDERKSEQIALAGESSEPALESFFAHTPVGIRGDQVALADYVELARFRLHGPEGDAGDDLLVEVVLPVGNLGLKLIEQRLLGAGQQMGRVTPNSGKRETICGERRFLVEERVQAIFRDGQNFGTEECGLGVNVGFEGVIGIA